jgi:GDP-4-dehydro-6-deoxy-D-mannose reductase
MIANAAYLRYQQNIVRLRLFNLIGPRLPDTLLSGRCTKLLAGIADKKPMKLEFGDLSTLRDYTDIRDISRAILSALTQGKAGRLYHIGSGQKTSGKQIIELLIKESGLRVKYESMTNRNQFSVPEQVADTTLAKDELDWTPSITLKQSVRDMWLSRDFYH